MNRIRLAAILLVMTITLPSFPALAKSIPSGMNCTEIKGLAPYLRSHRVVMFGEGHGTKEMPETFLRVVCSALSKGMSVAVGLEMPVDLSESLKAYMRSTGDQSARASLLQADFWKLGEDGRASLAMVEMIEGFRRLGQAGYPISIFAMQGSGRDWHINNDGKMAAKIRAEYSARPESLILTLTGNVHNMKVKPEWFPPELPAPIPTHITDLNPATFNLSSTGGSAWSCTETCGIHSVPVQANDNVFVVRESGLKDAYTGDISVGRTTASPPAVVANGP
ncbi:hypothetical protein [Massilia rhizosphaerae]|uniref:hypothetical protein n=1 Tax=Massilia rhizosphaerae TaxID=2784389 RepID=UPI0018DE7554|nr:hypothetical protein [Massilia rhizosphaerae]